MQSNAMHNRKVFLLKFCALPENTKCIHVCMQVQDPKDSLAQPISDIPKNNFTNSILVF